MYDYIPVMGYKLSLNCPSYSCCYFAFENIGIVPPEIQLKCIWNAWIPAIKNFLINIYKIRKVNIKCHIKISLLADQSIFFYTFSSSLWTIKVTELTQYQVTVKGFCMGNRFKNERNLYLSLNGLVQCYAGNMQLLVLKHLQVIIYLAESGMELKNIVV